MSSPPRMAVVWCPDWPVVAARSGAGSTAADVATAVVAANHVVACSPYAREFGVRRGMRRREAQSRCPDLVVLPRNEAAEVRCFEPAILAVEAVVAGVEVMRPGLLAVSAPGPARYLGGEPELVATLHRAAQTAVDDLEIGIADGAFAAEQAARRGIVVPAGESAAFLADLPIGTLDAFGDSPLVDVLQRLGIWTLGGFAALPAKDVVARFGPLGGWAHRQAGGRDDRPVVVREPPMECAVTVEFTPAVERVDVVAFSARGAAEKFITDLGARSLACACVELEVTTENGELLVRRWRQTGVLTAADVIDRIRWQVEGWLQHRGDGDSQLPSAGIARLRIAPIEVVSTGTHQQSLWGGDGESAARAQRALARVQTMIGFDAVVRPMVAGGRGPAQRTESVPWGLETAGLETAGLETAGLETAGLKTGRLETPGVDPALVRVSGRNPDDPWPGRLPSPAPSVVLDPPTPVRLLDGTGRSVVVSERGAVTHPPARLGIGQRSLVPVASWAGPWPADERWWDPVSAARVARVQLVDVHGRAYLLAGEMAGDREPRWVLEGIYD